MAQNLPFCADCVDLLPEQSVGIPNEAHRDSRCDRLVRSYELFDKPLYYIDIGDGMRSKEVRESEIRHAINSVTHSQAPE